MYERQKEQLFYFGLIRTAGLNTIDQENGSEMISNEMKKKVLLGSSDKRTLRYYCIALKIYTCKCSLQNSY